jgi:hypothetical protein
MRKQARRRLAAALVVLAFGASLVGFAQEAEEDFHMELSGRKTWTLRYGFGDAYGLALAGMAANQLVLDQTLAVEVTGEALSILTVKAHFNDQEPMNLQSLTVLLDAGDLTGVFGDFSLSGGEAFAVYNKKLLGGRLDYKLGPATLTGVLSQIEGTSESRTFAGTTAHEEVLFARLRADAPLEEAPYREHLDGLFDYLLRAAFVPDFSFVRLGLEASDGLALLLEAYDLGYLVSMVDSFVPEELPSGAFVVVAAEEGDLLLLKVEPSSLLRTRVKDLIKAYNEDNGLSGTARKAYPFNEGTAYERTFLAKLDGFGSLRVDEESYSLASAGRRRFYDLRRTGVKEDSVLVEVSLDGGTFRPITDPDLADYRAVPYPEEGAIELLFPESFFAGAKNRVRVAFDYVISGGAFSLGLSLVQGSEKVYLNGALLTRDVDYTIDYELGVLILFTTVTETDEIRIDYERFRGGLGAAAEFATNFYGLSLDWPVSEALAFKASLLQAADSPRPLVDPNRARTMPNRHTVAGVTGSMNVDGFSADLTLGVNDDRFPLDDNARTNLPNEVTGLLLLPGYTFVAHLDGVSVERDGIWSTYDAGDGLSASRVYDLISDGERVLFATASGLTVLSLEGDAPLDRVGNWCRYAEADGLPNATVLAVTLVQGRLWLGTAGGLASVEISGLDDPAEWTSYAEEEAFAELGGITALAGDEEVLYLGTEEGLFAFDLASGEVRELPGMSGTAVHDLLLEQGTLYAACDRGLRSFRGESGTGWLAFGRKVYAVSSRRGVLAWGSEEGLERSDGETLLQGRAVTAVAFAEGGTLWAGTRADGDYHLLLAELTAAGLRTVSDEETGIDGRDRARFADTPAEGHTDQGMIERFHFRREMDSFSLSGTFENVSPEFTAIGRLGRTDSLGWDLASEGTLFAGVDFDLSHAYHVVDRMTDPSGSLENSVSLSWEFGPRATLAVEQSAVDDDVFRPGFESGKLSYALSLSDRLFGDALDLALNWRDAFTAREDAPSRRDNQVSLSGTWKPAQGLAIAFGASRPVTRQGEQVSGSERASLSADWTGGVPLVDITASYDLAASRPLTEPAFQLAHTGKVGLRGQRFDLLGLAITPTAEGSAELEDDVLSLSGQGTLRGTGGGLSLRATYGAERSGVGETQGRRVDRLSLGIDYAGFPDLKPSLSYTDTTNTVAVGDRARVSRTQAMTGRLLWTPEQGPRNELSLTVRSAAKSGETTLTATLRNSLSAALLETVTGRLDLDGSYRLAEDATTLDLTLRAGADVRLTEMWEASLSGSLRAGRRESGAPYVGGILELFVSATF